MSTGTLPQIPRPKGMGGASRRTMRRRNGASMRTFAPKLRADYSDLLGMSDIAEQPAPAVSQPDALLSKLVQEHLVRAGAASTSEKGSDPISKESSAGAPKTAADLIIPSEPFKATEQAAEKNIASEPFKAAEPAPSEMIRSEPFKATAPASAAAITGAPFEQTSPNHGGASVSAAELDALLSQDAQPLVEQEQETAKASSAPVPVGDAQEQLNQADGVMAAELSQLIDNSDSKAAAVVPAAPVQAALPTDVKPPEAQPAPNIEAAAAIPKALRRGFHTWLAALVRDLLLMVAQAFDLPFMQFSEEVKKLIAFAGLVLLVSGGVLLIVGCIHH